MTHRLSIPLGLMVAVMVNGCSDGGAPTSTKSPASPNEVAATVQSTVDDVADDAKDTVADLTSQVEDQATQVAAQVEQQLDGAVDQAKQAVSGLQEELVAGLQDQVAGLQDQLDMEPGELLGGLAGQESESTPATDLLGGVGGLLGAGEEGGLEVDDVVVPSQDEADLEAAAEIDASNAESAFQQLLKEIEGDGDG